MFEGIQFKLRLRRLQRSRQRVRKQCDSAIEKARRDGDRANEELLIFERHTEDDSFEDAIWSLQDQHLRVLAERCLIPVPEISDEGAWVESKVLPGTWRFSPETRMRLREQIHDERKGVRDKWIPWIAAATGLIGAATGLVAAFGSWLKG